MHTGPCTCTAVERGLPGPRRDEAMRLSRAAVSRGRGVRLKPHNVPAPHDRHAARRARRPRRGRYRPLQGPGALASNVIMTCSTAGRRPAVRPSCHHVVRSERRRIGERAREASCIYNMSPLTILHTQHEALWFWSPGSWENNQLHPREPRASTLKKVGDHDVIPERP